MRMDTIGWIAVVCLVMSIFILSAAALGRMAGANLREQDARFQVTYSTSAVRIYLDTKTGQEYLYVYGQGGVCAMPRESEGAE